jgi:hypothetical protein
VLLLLSSAGDGERSRVLLLLGSAGDGEVGLLKLRCGGAAIHAPPPLPADGATTMDVWALLDPVSPPIL